MSFWFGVSCSKNSKNANIPGKFAAADDKVAAGAFVERHFPQITGQFPYTICAMMSAVGACSRDENNNLFQVQADMPMSAVYQLGFRFLDVQIKEERQASQTKSAFDVLMQCCKKYDKMPPERNPITAKDKMYNDVRSTLQRIGVGFTANQVSNLGKRVVGDIVEVLWYLDPFHQRLQKRNIVIPEIFTKFQGYKDHVKQHKRTPEIQLSQLKSHCETLSDLLVLPWFGNTGTPFAALHGYLESLLNAMGKYLSYMTSKQASVTDNHKSPEPVRAYNDNWGFSSHSSTKDEISKQYKNLVDEILKRPFYDPIDLSDYEPLERLERRKWYAKLHLPVSYGLYKYSYGNNLGNLTCIWKIPEEMEQRSQSDDIKIINEVKANVKPFATRQMRKDFFEQYSMVSTKLKPHVMRSIYKYLTGHEFAAANECEYNIDQRVVDFLVGCDDPKLVMDLRANNGRVADSKFDKFWDELGKFLDEKSVVNDRRHGETMYMPFAISVADLRAQILDRLPEDTPAPSKSWIRMNFQPSNGYKDSAAKYTGRFDVKYKVQQRMLRAEHVDARFCYHQYTLLKYFAVQYKDHVNMQCLDDKAIVPVGDPGKASAATARKHNRSLVVGNCSLVALDHDYHVCGIVPSVCLNVAIPNSPRESFYKGDVHITVKDKIMQPSSPLRHATETVKIVRESASDDHVNMNKEILVRFTDGGPDHRTTYKSVQVANMIEFVSLNLDMFVHCRTAPNHSFVNPAERVMSLLNLGLQNVALARSEMEPGHELKMKSLSSLKSVRSRGGEGLLQALKQSMEAPINVVADVFSRLRRSSGQVHVHKGCSADELDLRKCQLKLIDNDADVDDGACMTHLKQFYDTHCQARQYSFQVDQEVSSRKGARLSLLQHVSTPRLTEEVYQTLHYLPDPVLDENQSFMSFEKVYGMKTDDSARPSLKEKPSATERDKQFKNLMVQGKVRAYVMCVECGKRRVVYAASKLTNEQQQVVLRLSDELLYVCGATLLPGSSLQDKLVVCEGINCQTHMETQYYVSVTQVFEDVCFYCGDTDLGDSSEVQDLKRKHSIVRPICNSCLRKGFRPPTRCAKKQKK